jgi:hypothetical protein
MFTHSSTRSRYQRTRAKTQLQSVSVLTKLMHLPCQTTENSKYTHTLGKIKMSVTMNVW